MRTFKTEAPISFLKIVPVLIGVFLIGLSPRAHSGIIYSQLFGNTNSILNLNDNTTPSVDTDWKAYLASNNLLATSEALIGTATGSTNGVANVNSTPIPAVSTVSGYAYGVSVPVLFETSYHTITSPSNFSSLQFSWAQSDNSSSSTMQMAVEVGNSWYVSVQTFVSTGGAATLATAGAQETFTYTATATNWDQLLINGSSSNPLGTSGSGITIGSVASSPLSGDIQAFGLLDLNGGGGGLDRFDTFTISGVPEPVPSQEIVTGLMALLAVAVFRWRRPVPFG